MLSATEAMIIIKLYGIIVPYNLLSRYKNPIRDLDPVCDSLFEALNKGMIVTISGTGAVDMMERITDPISWYNRAISSLPTPLMIFVVNINEYKKICADEHPRDRINERSLDAWYKGNLTDISNKSLHTTVRHSQRASGTMIDSLPHGSFTMGGTPFTVGIGTVSNSFHTMMILRTPFLPNSVVRFPMHIYTAIEMGMIDTNPKKPGAPPYTDCLIVTKDGKMQLDLVKHDTMYGTRPPMPDSNIMIMTPCQIGGPPNYNLMKKSVLIIPTPF
ncbi:hypothetical protein NUW58_g3947 [Xylaria curta]|uniref:Uncharacterized protein n=1 Tax=Xylaria curta TaxID=42375 RepID=A0ACC1PA24_9PEZI|nr:hypothetical protein NUW58_g3947 [Xylaria curta]